MALPKAWQIFENTRSGLSCIFCGRHPGSHRKLRRHQAQHPPTHSPSRREKSTYALFPVYILSGKYFTHYIATPSSLSSFHSESSVSGFLDFIVLTKDRLQCNWTIINYSINRKTNVAWAKVDMSTVSPSICLLY